MATLTDLTNSAKALKNEGRLDEAVAVFAEAVRLYPRSGVAEHNLAATLGDAGKYAEAEAAARRAIAKGLDAAETWLVRARSSFWLGDYAAAAAHYDAALQRNPALHVACFEAAQLTWMLFGDKEAVLQQIHRQGSGALLTPFVTSQALAFMGDLAGARDALAPLVAGGDALPEVLAYAAHLAGEAGDTDAAMHFATAALRRAPTDGGAIEAMIRAALCAGHLAYADELAGRLLRLNPLDQQAIALQLTAWRALGDQRYRAFSDYVAATQACLIDVPKGWPDHRAYLCDLSAELEVAHPFIAHPFGQSVRLGSQRSNILDVPTPAIQAFRSAIAGPIDRFIGAILASQVPIAARAKAAWRIAGDWSVWLRPGGHHIDHVHPDGWISSACYIAVPGRVDEGGREGWLRFGRPGLRVTPPLPAEHWVRPQPGLLVLFPSYMWHGTMPFGGNEARLTIAFDIVPD